MHVEKRGAEVLIDFCLFSLKKMLLWPVSVGEKLFKSPDTNKLPELMGAATE